MKGQQADFEQYTETVVQQASAVAPQAGQVITDSGSLPEGMWEVYVETSYGGTASTIDDMELWVNGVKRRQLTAIPVANANPVRSGPHTFRLSKDQPIQVKATAGGAAGTVYRAVIIATPYATLALY